MNDTSSNESSSTYEILTRLQQGIPLTPTPFTTIADELSCSETQILTCLQQSLVCGLARRFGGVLNSSALGYQSTLCAADVPPQEIERLADRLSPFPQITHCYEREGQPNLWFTVTSAQQQFAHDMTTLQQLLEPYAILNLPALRRFKISTVFDLTQKQSLVPQSLANKPVDHISSAQFSPFEKEIVRRIQTSIHVTPNPFLTIAEELSCSQSDITELLQRWKTEGVLRRVALIVSHRKAGLSANAMCVWKISPDIIESCGLALAACPEVTHCYQRPSMETIPFNLYAMIHADSMDVAKSILDRISEQAQLPTGRMLVSLREFKKSSPLFFQEESTP